MKGTAEMPTGIHVPLPEGHYYAASFPDILDLARYQG
jgi:hypothetical protein